MEQNTFLGSQKESISHLIANSVDFNSDVYKPNLKNPVKQCLKFFRSDPNLIITKADKGGQIVLLDKTGKIS